MENKFVKFVKNNLIIVVPAIVVLLVLTGFLIFGFSNPDTVSVYTRNTVLEDQALLEERFVEAYETETHDESNPFFVLDPYDVSPLSGLLMFETATEQQFKIIVRGKELEGNIEYITPKETIHYIPVYGLYPDHNNIIEIYLYSDTTPDVLVNTVYALTDELPNDVSVPTEIITTYEYFGDDIMMMLPALKSFPVGYDFKGDVRWYLTKNLSWAPEMLSNGHMLLGSDRLVSDPYYTTGIYEVDYLGKIYFEYKIPGGYHHDMVELPNSNLLVLTNDFEGTVEDKVVEVSRIDGSILDTWDLEELLPKLDGMSEMWTTYDWFHNNSISYDQVNDAIILSGRHQDIVVSVGKTSHELNWVIGDPDNFGELFTSQYFFTPIGDEFEWQYAQHSAMLLPDGNIFIFDNGNNKSKFTESYISIENSYSRGVIYNIDTDNMTIEQVYEFGKDLGVDFYSPYISNVDFYSEGHYMIHSGGHGEVDGVALNIPGPLYEDPSEVEYRSVTYEVENDLIEYYLEVEDNYYQAKRINFYNDEVYFRLGSGISLGELAETKVFEGTYDVKFSLLDTVPPRFEVSVLKEADRFVFNAKLDRNDTVYMLLVEDESMETIKYEIPTSRTAYTAMCSAAFQGDERYITYYINETNITGSFDVYLVINGREYNTYKHVDFN